MTYEGGVLDGQASELHSPCQRLYVALTDGRRVIGWDDGPIYSYPEAVYYVEIQSAESAVARFSHIDPA